MAENVRGQNRSSAKDSMQTVTNKRTNDSPEGSSIRNGRSERRGSDGRDMSRTGFYPRRNIRIDDFDGQLSDE
ncbi:MAG TPA: hypothetical protein VM935_19725 [Chitinophagaceae bacterium]|jgi:hypothetical protein|nr:hypothetical protein [Chitinophagaceae bacterium]